MKLSTEEKERAGKDTTCEYCGKSFIVQKDTKGIFCSRKCQIDIRRRYITKPCPICNKSFTVPFYRRRVKYCSKECLLKGTSLGKVGKKRTEEFKQKISESQKDVWERRKKGELPERNAETWHTEEWKKSQSERISGLYAEDKINKSWQKIHKADEELIIEYYMDFYSAPKIAQMLGVSKSAVLSCLKRNNIPRRNPVGEFHPQWKGGVHKYNRSRNYGYNWHERKKEILLRDEHTCQLCGRKDKLEVHHINPIRLFSPEEKETKGNDKDNLITLCMVCHRVEHEVYMKGIKNVV